MIRPIGSHEFIRQEGETPSRPLDINCYETQQPDTFPDTFTAWNMPLSPFRLA